MFKELSIDLTTYRKPWDIGLICQALLYYGKVNLIVGGATRYLAEQMGVYELRELLQSGRLTINYDEFTQIYGQISDQEGQFAYYTVPDDSGRANYSAGSLREHVLMELRPVGIGRDTKDLHDEIFKTAKVFNPKAAINEEIWDDLLDERTLSLVTKSVLNRTGENYLDDDFFIKAIKINPGAVAFETDHKIKVLEQVAENPAVFFTNIIVSLTEVNRDIYLASEFNCTLNSTELTGGIFERKAQRWINRQRKENSELSKFNEMVFGNPFRVREAINSRSLSIRDFIKILNAADKSGFREWIDELDDSATLIHEYHRKLFEETDLQRFYAPVKGVQFGLFNGLNILLGYLVDPVVSAVAGLALGGADGMLSKRIQRGWRPRIFVTEYLGKIKESPGNGVVKVDGEQE